MARQTLRDAYQLFHDGTLALAEVEQVGMRIDVPRLDATIERTRRREIGRAHV